MWFYAEQYISTFPRGHLSKVIYIRECMSYVPCDTKYHVIPNTTARTVSSVYVDLGPRDLNKRVVNQLFQLNDSARL